MSKPVAIGLILFFIALISLGMLFLIRRDTPLAPPLGNGSDAPFPRSGQDTTSPPDTSTPQSQRDLIQLTNGAVSGFQTTKTGALYVERATGHVFDITPTGDTETKISNTTIPQIFNVVWSPNNDGAILGYREGEETQSASTEFTNLSTKGVLLPKDIVAFDYAPERSRIFYLTENDDELIGIAANPDNGAQAEIIRLPKADFLVDWFSPREISFLTRPSGTTDGFLYRYHIDRGSFDKLLGDIPGLDIKWSPDGSRVLFSSFNPQLKQSYLSVRNVKVGTTHVLGVAGFSQKCAWSGNDTLYCAVPISLPSATYPDAWLRGSVQTNDRVMQINTDTLEASIIKTLPNIDIKDIQVAPDGTYLYFQNKKDGTLWSLKLVD